MRIIVRIVRGWRKIVMAVPRLLIWGVLVQIYFMRRESWDRRDLSLVGPSSLQSQDTRSDSQYAGFTEHFSAVSLLFF